MKKTLLSLLLLVTVMTGSVFADNPYAATGNEQVKGELQILSDAKKTTNNILTAADLGAPDGWSIQCTGNTTKTLGSGSSIKINGKDYFSIKLSNGAQNTVTLPSGYKANAVTIYAVVNKDAAARTCYWKEVGGTEYDTPEVDHITSYKDFTNPTVSYFTLSGDSNSFTFTNAGEQVFVVLVVDYSEPSAEMVGLDAPKISYDNTTGEVTIGKVENAAKVVYTTDGKEPNADSEEYTNPFTVEDGTVVQAMAIGDDINYYNSPSATETVWLIGKTVADPVISQLNGTFALSSETKLANFKYSFDDGVTWEDYIIPVTLYEDAKVKAKAFRENWSESGVSEAEIVALPALKNTKIVYLGAGAFNLVDPTSDHNGMLQGIVDGEADGYSIEIIHKDKKNWAKGDKITISEGLTRTAYYGSNNAQNIITLPDGVKALRVAFYSYNTDPGASGWKEVNGEEFPDFDKVPLLSRDASKPDVRVFDLKDANGDAGVTGSFTFTDGGVRPAFVMVLEIEDPEAKPGYEDREDANISWNVETTTLKVRDPFTAPVFSNPDNVPVTFKSSDEKVATVDEYGKITLAGGIGEAVITATYNGEADDAEFKTTAVKTTIKVETNVKEVYAWDEFEKVETIPTTQLWKAEETSGSLKAGTKLIDDDNITIETVYAANYTDYHKNYLGEEFPATLQLRVKDAPSADVVSGTENSGSTPLVVTPKKDCKVVMFMRRQGLEQKDKVADEDDKEKNEITRTHYIGMTPNDGKSVVASAHSDISNKIDQELVYGEYYDPAKGENDYLACAAVWELKAGEKYTLWAKGTTIGMHAIGYYVPKVYDYSVQIKLDETTRPVTSGTWTEGEEVTVPYSRFIMEDNGTVWQKDATNKQFAAPVVPTENNYVKTIEYTKTDKKGIFFTEAENLPGIAAENKVAESFLSNGGGAYAAEPIQVTTLPAGEYRVSFGFMGDKGDVFKVMAGEKVVLTATATEADWEQSKISANFTLNAESTPITVVGATGEAHILDYVLIAGRKATADDLKYIVKFVDEEGNVIKDQEERSGAFGEEIVLGADDKEPYFNENNEKYIFVDYDKGLKVNADVNKTVVNIKYRKAPEFSYTVLAKLGESDDLVDLKSGSNWEGEEETVPYSRYMISEGKVYKRDATESQYNVTFTLGEDDLEVELPYAETAITDYILFAEAGSLPGVTRKESARCSNAEGAYKEGAITVTTLKPGKYKMYMGVSSFENATYTVKGGEKTLFTTVSNNAWKEDVKEFTLNEESAITIEGTALNKILDYVLITGKEDIALGVYSVEAAGNDKWYTINGLELTEKPTVPGIYIHNGKKVIVK